MNGYNFTERVRKVLAISREEASALGHDYVGTEHLVLALIAEGEGVAIAALRELGIDLDAVGIRIHETVKRGRPQPGSDLPYTSRAKKVLEFAMTEARELSHSYVGTEHLLLGILREEKGIGAQVLNDAGVELDAARDEVVRLLGTEVSGAQREVRSQPTRPERRLWANTTAAFVDASGGESSPGNARRLRSLPPADWSTERARTVIGRARAEAANRRSRHIEPEHLLIALLQEQEGMASTILQQLAVDRVALARAAAGAIEETLATDESFELDIAYSDSAEAALRHSFHEARLTRDRRVGTDHVLLGLVLEENTPAGRVLAEAGLTADAIRTQRARIAG
jgi:ATP-dependent Clp protease ATP-binding subunit ClpA